MILLLSSGKPYGLELSCPAEAGGLRSTLRLAGSQDKHPRRLSPPGQLQREAVWKPQNRESRSHFDPKSPGSTHGSPPRPLQAPRPQRGAPDKSSGPCARGAAEGPCDYSRGWQAFPCRGLLRFAAECPAKGQGVGGRSRVETDCQVPCGDSDRLTWF